MIKMSSREFGKAMTERPFAILPLGSFEQHGPAGALTTDYLTATAISEKIAEKSKLILIPGIPYGYSDIHLNFPGTIHVEGNIYRGLVETIVESLKHHGIKGVVLLNGHGGNLIPLKEYIEENNDCILLLQWFELSENEFFPDDHKSHAGSEELSVLAAIAPMCVRKEMIVNMEPVSIPRKDNEPLRMEQFTKNGVHLKADRMNEEVGKLIIEYVVDKASQQIEEFITRIGRA